MLQLFMSIMVDRAKASGKSKTLLPELRRAAVIPPATPGSVGDAAMISATVAQLRAAGFTEVDLFYGKSWPLDEAVDRRVCGERFFYLDRPSQQVRLIRRLSHYSHVYFIGADVIDGAYNPGSVARRLSLLNYAADIGRKARILGASYNEHPEGTTFAALCSLPERVTICARDPASYDRLRQHFGIRVKQVADLAFLLQPKPAHPDAVAAIKWIQSRRAAGERVLAFNANYLHVAKDANLRSALVTLMNRLLGAGFSLLLLPHDSRTDESDKVVLRNAAARTERRFAPQIHLLDTVSPGAIKAALAEVDLLASGRLHAMILALGGGTPVLGFAYQHKFEGVMDLFGLAREGLLSSPQELAEHPERIAERIVALADRSGELRQKIVDALPGVTALAKLNFE